MSDDPEYPEPTAEERALQREQANLLREQGEMIRASKRQQDLFAPMLFAEMGYEPRFNIRNPETGELLNPNLPENELIGITKMADPEADANEALRSEIETSLLERSKAALAGELPIDPALKRSLERTELQKRRSLADQLGPGWETSTPGIEALGRMEESHGMIEAGARRGDLSLSEQLSHARESSTMGRSEMDLRRLLGIPGRDLPFANALGQAGAGMNAPIGNMAANRAGQFQASLGGLQARTSLYGSLAEGAGNIAGMALYGKMKSSDQRLKTDIKKVGRMNGHNIYEYYYVWGGPKQIGVIAQEVLKKVPEAVMKIGGYLAVDYNRLWKAV